MQDLPCGVVDDSVELRDGVPSFRIVDGAAPEGLLQEFQNDRDFTLVQCNHGSLPPELLAELRSWANHDLRSLNAQIEFLLAEALRRRKGGGRG